jgi:putative ABC transport system permease protein
MGTMRQDLRYAIRTLLKSPGFTVVAVLTLALGIGANTAIFSVIDSVLLRPLPFHHSDRLVQLWETESSPGTYPFAGADYLDWQSQNRTLEATTLFTWGEAYNAGISSSNVDSAMGISTQANFFSVLGVEPIAGRTFEAGEDQAGKNHVAVLSYAFWKRHFGGEPSAVGRTIVLDGQSYAVIGVMPAWFKFPFSPLGSTDLWTPMDMAAKALSARGNHSYRAIGRLRQGVTPRQAQADLASIAQNLEKQYPNTNDKVGAVVVPLQESLTANSRPALLILLGAVALVLLIACANIANLLLARATGRQREVTLRAVLGATRWRIVRQLLTESVLLSMASAALGFFAAAWSIRLLESARALPIPRELPLRIDSTVLMFTIGVSLMAGILFGLAPALYAAQLDLNGALKSAAQSVVGASGWRRVLSDGLVVGEIALSLALLVGAGLLLRSFAGLRSTDIGAQTKNVLTMGIVLPAARYATLPVRRAFFERLTEELEHTPGIQAASVSTRLPLRGGSNSTISVEGDKDPAHASQLVEFNCVTPDYFRVFSIPFLSGANFSPQDMNRTADVNLKIDELFKQHPETTQIPAELSFVAVINRSMARTFWPNQDPIGKMFNWSGVQVKVLGVVGDTKQWDSIRDPVLPQIYCPLTATMDGPGAASGRVAVQTSVSPMSVLPVIRSKVQGFDSSLAVFRPETMEEVVADSTQDTGLQTYMLGAFAALATLLAAIGLYSVMAYLVTQRTHEFGVRMALGAKPGDVFRLALRRGAILTVCGIAAGLLAAFALTRVMANLLFGVSASDPITFVGVAILLSVVALLACYLPARRATRVSPLIALRYE